MRILLGFLCLAISATALGQNTGGVFGPVVNADHRGVEYRIGHDPDASTTAQRFHYQQSLDGDRMWRIVGQVRDTDDSFLDFDYLQGELFWQLTWDEKPWQQGVRFDVRIRHEGRPGTVGLNWMHQFPVSPNWRARLLLLSAVDVGQNARDGLFLQTRGQIARSLSGNKQFGFEIFNAHGSTDDFPDLSDQSFQLGPFYSTPISREYRLYASALFGVTDGAADLNLGLWITRAF